MMSIDAQAELADATTALMRTCAVVTAQTMTASACRGLTLWSDLLRAPGKRSVGTLVHARDTTNALWRVPSPVDWMPKFGSWPLGSWTSGNLPSWGAYASLWASPAGAAWAPFSDWTNWSRAYWPAWGSHALLPEAIRVAAPAAYAIYRSPGGHAVAQIFMPARARS